MTGEIDFSAQFGGRDAADAMLPHFRALKAAARDKSLNSLPFDKLAFILRVDGEVTEFGQSGVCNLDLDTDGEYVSIDIGVAKKDRRTESGPEGVADFLIDAIQASVSFLQNAGDRRLERIDFEDLRNVLSELCDTYRLEVKKMKESTFH